MVAAMSGWLAVKYTEFPDVDHGSWTPAWQEPNLIPWLFAQSKNQTSSAKSSGVSTRKAARDESAAVTGASASALPRSGRSQGTAGNGASISPDLGAYEAGYFGACPTGSMKPISLDTSKSYPLVVSLHGAGGKGSDNKANMRMAWLAALAREELRRKYPCFVL